MRYITILTSKEMAEVLDISPATLDNYLHRSKPLYDPNFPVIRVGGYNGQKRFVKEKVLEYWERKKKRDIIPCKTQYSLLLSIDHEQFQPLLSM